MHHEVARLATVGIVDSGALNTKKNTCYLTELSNMVSDCCSSQSETTFDNPG